jgi:hypothetical protein
VEEVPVIDDDDDDTDYVLSDVREKDDVLSTSYVNSDEESEYDNENGNNGDDNPSTWSMYEEHWKAFYNVYTPLYNASKCSMHLITNEKYDWLLSILRSKPSKKDPMNVRKARHIYTLGGNVENCCLFRDGKTVTTFERIFDVILQAHRKIGHARDVKKNKDTVNDDLMFYNVPRVAVKCFVDTCPMVS